MFTVWILFLRCQFFFSSNLYLYQSWLRQSIWLYKIIAKYFYYQKNFYINTFEKYFYIKSTNPFEVFFLKVRRLRKAVEKVLIEASILILAPPSGQYFFIKELRGTLLVTWFQFTGAYWKSSLDPFFLPSLVRSDPLDQLSSSLTIIGMKSSQKTHKKWNFFYYILPKIKATYFFLQIIGESPLIL